MKGKVSYKKDKICYTKGMTKQDIISVIKGRMEKRQVELDKRKWIHDEYVRLQKLQDEERDWLIWVERSSDDDWKPRVDTPEE